MVSLLHITPDDTIATRLERSQRPGFSSRVRRIGLPNASPTIAIVLTPSRSIVSSSTTGSKLRLSSVTMLPPPDRVDRHGKFPVPCICGQAGRKRDPGAGVRAAQVGGRAVLVQRAPQRGVERHRQVVLPPHHALGHAGRAAGVEEVEIVAAASPRRHDPSRAARRRCLVRVRPVGAVARAVIHPQPRPHLRQLVPDRPDGRGERAMEDHGAGIGVVPEVEQFVGGVPVVRVDRHERRLERGVHRLEVLRAVVEVLGHRLLTGQTGVEQVLGDAVGTTIDLTPGAAVLTVDQARCVGQIVGDDLPHVGEVPVSHACTATRPGAVESLSNDRSAPTRRAA